MGGPWSKTNELALLAEKGKLYDGLWFFAALHIKSVKGVVIRKANI